MEANMKKRSGMILIILVVFLILLIPAYFLMVKSNEKREAEETADDTEKVLDISTSDVTSVEFTLDEQQVLFRLEDDTWKLEGDDSFEVEATAVENVISTVAEMTSARTLEDVEDLSEYGLTNPSQTVTLTLQDGTTYNIYFGDSNESTGNDYVYVDSDKTKVYTVDYSIAQTFDGTLDDFQAEEDDTEEDTAEEDTAEEDATEEE
jgi:preprotein translocase subunit YajC